MVDAICHCGCGRPTAIARRTDPTIGWVKGRPLKYVKGHHGARGPDKRQRKHREDGRELRSNWKGGRRIRNGYVELIGAAGSGKHRREHVVIAEAVLGRRFRLGEQVHHVNRQRTDNRNSNLCICPSPAYHAELHRKMKVRAAGGNPWTDRHCCYCHETKHESEFYQCQTKRGLRFHSICRQCARRDALERQFLKEAVA